MVINNDTLSYKLLYILPWLKDKDQDSIWNSFLLDYYFEKKIFNVYIKFIETFSKR